MVDSIVLHFNKLLPLFSYLIVGVELFVQMLIDFVSFIELVGQGVENLALLFKKLSRKLRRRAVPSLLFFQQLDFLLVFADHFPLLVENLLNWCSARMDELRVEGFDLLLEHFLFFSLFEKLIWSLLKGFNNVFLVLFNLLLLFLKLNEFRLVN